MTKIQQATVAGPGEGSQRESQNTKDNCKSACKKHETFHGSTSPTAFTTLMTLKTFDSKRTKEAGNIGRVIEEAHVMKETDSWRRLNPI